MNNTHTDTSLLHSSQNLPNEALEEFLSILKPTFLTMPKSYNFSAGFDRASARVSPLRHLTGSFSPAPSSPGVHQSELSMDGRKSAAPSPVVDRSNCTTPIRGTWFSTAILSSPVSRMQTRNPFVRNLDARSPVGVPRKISASPLPVMGMGSLPIPTTMGGDNDSDSHMMPLSLGAPPSPAAIPLPVPSPDEMSMLEAV
ncbi:hypothetical protein CVT24_010387 [Panaeolus cyanescens]|uniref:Uncharacterized protein n=1 Tax=Panaeolus cyanescens TaxID=181874 RepID=A0A409X2Q8_9AGAR|nr:hypothetical protein CVT24_010387 [Panaeolus cyanescens]